MFTIFYYIFQNYFDPFIVTHHLGEEYIMNSLAVETTYSVLLPKLATGHYFEPLNSNLCPDNWVPKDPA
jgi:hypothetical protein